jgi:hypothetical protein
MESKEPSTAYIGENAGRYKVPYQNVKELIFANVKKDELVDAEHSARLQYRLLLMDAVIRAYVDFPQRKIFIIYNPEGADSKLKKASRQELVAFLAGQGVHVSENEVQENDLDYYSSIYAPQYNPPSVREHPPYGYTPEEWKKMKVDYEKRRLIWDEKNREKFRAWQLSYLKRHPELSAELGKSPE